MADGERSPSPGKRIDSRAGYLGGVSAILWSRCRCLSFGMAVDTSAVAAL
jgi:hypothetical protein